jgi:hypothetical protein
MIAVNIILKVIIHIAEGIVDTAPEETELRMVKSITRNLPPIGAYSAISPW